MGIDKDIHQGKFNNSYQKAVINLLFTYGWTIERIKLVLKNADITPQQFNILRILRGSFPKPISTLQIRERMLDKMSDTSRIVDRLAAKKLVKKIVCATDKRLVDITISEKGEGLLKLLDGSQKKIDDIFGKLTANDAETLSDLLDKIRS